MFQAPKSFLHHGLSGLALAAALCAPLQSEAQSLNFGDTGNDTPVEVLADNGIEWLRDGKRFIARGNASATRGKTTVYADTLTAHYRKTEAGKSQLWRLDADGNTRIVSPTETATGDTAVYDMDTSVLVLRGKPHAKLETPDTVITAKQSLEYYQVKRMAVARGNAVIVRDDRTMKADLVTAYFSDKSKTGKSQVDIVDAFGHVTITTPTETVTGDKGRYNVKTGIATILNNVHMTRGTDTLKGAYAVVNMKTGVSTLYATLPGQPKTKDTQVKGVFTPKSDQAQ